MRILALLILMTVLIPVSFSPVIANDVPLKKAYSYYFQGNMPEAIAILEEYAQKHPDARVLYFIGYAYYEMKDFKNANRYFNDAYLVDPDFTPIPPVMGQNNG